MRGKGRIKRVNLALQGGGSFGAFTWGVLDRVLEDERLEIAAVSGASAGAMNAVAMIAGFTRGGRDEARACLRKFWMGVADAAEGRWAGFAPGPLRSFLGGWGGDLNPFNYWGEVMMRAMSPYDFNPLNYSPLRDLLSELVDFERVRACEKMQAFISATNVHTGRVRVFERTELTADHIMASACLPFLFQAVVIEGAPYWDGGYMGNPPLWPLFEHSDSEDTIVVQINPLERDDTPKTAREIMDRVNEITFNASLLREFRAIDFVNRLMEDGRLQGTGYRRVLIHMIEDPDRSLFNQGSRLRANRAMIEELFGRGRGAAEAWLERNFRCLGDASTVNLRKLFQGEADALDGERIDLEDDQPPKRAAHKPPPSRASGCDR